MYLLDSDTLSLFHREHAKVVERMSKVAAGDVGTTIVNRAEIMRARYEYLLKASDLKQFLIAQQWIETAEGLFSGMIIVKLNDKAVKQFELLKKVRGLAKIGRVDMLIASIALATDSTLVTRNLRHFSLVPKLKIENWAD